MELTILGCYGGYPANGIGTSSYLLTSGDYHLLLDCGSGALMALEKVLDPLQLDAVLLTHYHHDHTADVGVLQYLWQLKSGVRREPMLPIYGHAADPLNFGSLTWPNATTGIAYDPTKPLNLGPFRIEFLMTEHPVPAYAPRITERSTGHSLAFTADTRDFAGLIPWAHEADCLLADTNFFADHEGPAWHLTSIQAGKLARKAQVNQLLLTHLPQTGYLGELRDEAASVAGHDLPVAVVRPGKVYKI
ncbi:beta-lactamase superfamily hydrolase [Levilactobacillus senmaizukei DSM 21775 = NBRC 103853]|uniref:Beta-lactamase superfamily hydrolase n=1 Tax=Levilactobacillus senmaizukei DSM 21775 = NBRC 103853 TaxID=1423803 RepID=A0A0R2DP78_9LACO|nr:MBL fold metallo-hydrolase [Levilactobacillus senmaizukei]KRN01620.1 beta-lactamase superfamily hydrolase [Levilactobacillus senmaizukei DSM 21775 = NBRC 103853]